MSMRIIVAPGAFKNSLTAAASAEASRAACSNPDSTPASCWPPSPTAATARWMPCWRPAASAQPVRGGAAGRNGAGGVGAAA